MAQVITLAGERLFALKAQNNQQLDIDTFIFAYVPGQDSTALIDRNEGLPPVNQRVHTQIVQQYGMIEENAVVYSSVLDSLTGPFQFNWVGLYSAVNQTLIAIQHIPTVSKTVTEPGASGNIINRNFVIEYSGIAELTGITVAPETWQIDYTARLNGMDELTRQLAVDMNGKDWFIGDGFKVVPRSTLNTFKVTAGVGYVSGLRVELAADHILTLSSYPQFVYVDAWFDGTSDSIWKGHVAFTVTNTEMDDYIDVNGRQHYISKMAILNSADNVVDLRDKKGIAETVSEIIEVTKELKIRCGNIVDYGADMTGVMPSAWACIAAQNDLDYIVIPPGILNLSDDVVSIKPNKKWEVQGTLITQSASADKRLFEAINANGSSFNGHGVLKGNATLADINGPIPMLAEEVGFYIASSGDFNMGNFSIRQFRRRGMHLGGDHPPIVQPGGSYTYGERGRFGCLGFYGNVVGLDAEPNNGGEYNNFGICDFANNNIGIELGAGNLSFSGGGSNGNRVNLYLKGGPNNGHGRIVGLSLNHGKPLNIYAENVTEGMSIVACHSYGNNSIGDGRIEIVNSKGIHFSGGTMDCRIIVDESGPLSGYNYINDVYMPKGYGLQSVINQLGKRPKSLIITGAKGDGSFNEVDSNNAINDVSPVYVACVRDQAEPQNLSSGVSTRLIFPDASRCGDNRGAFNYELSELVVPTPFSGKYEFKHSLFFAGATLEEDKCYVQLKVNGEAVKAYYPSLKSTATGTESISFSGSEDFYFEAGDTVTVHAVIVGTVLQFGFLSNSTISFELLTR